MMRPTPSRDPRRLPNPEELRKTTEPFDRLPNIAPPDRGAINQAMDNSNCPGIAKHRP
jgi:hypothetical protein